MWPEHTECTDCPALSLCSCVIYLSCCCDKVSEKGSMREEEFTMAHTLKNYDPSRWTALVAGT